MHKFIILEINTYVINFLATFSGCKEYQITLLQFLLLDSFTVFT